MKEAEKEVEEGTEVEVKEEQEEGQKPRGHDTYNKINIEKKPWKEKNK